MSGGPLPDYIRRRLDLEDQRRRHKQEAAPGCRCLVCMGPEALRADFDARMREQERRNGPPPF